MKKLMALLIVMNTSLAVADQSSVSVQRNGRPGFCEMTIKGEAAKNIYEFLKQKLNPTEFSKCNQINGKSQICIEDSSALSEQSPTPKYMCKILVNEDGGLASPEIIFPQGITYCPQPGGASVGN